MKALGKEIWQNENARKTISAFLTTFQEIINDKTAGQLIVSVSRLIKDLLKSETSEQCLEIIANSMAEIFTNKVASNNLQMTLNNSKTLSSNPNTLKLARAVLHFLDELMFVPQMPILIHAVGDGIDSLMKYEKPRETIMNGFRNLKFITGSPSINSATTIPITDVAA